MGPEELDPEKPLLSEYLRAAERHFYAKTGLFVILKRMNPTTQGVFTLEIYFTDHGPVTLLSHSKQKQCDNTGGTW